MRPVNTRYLPDDLVTVNITERGPADGVVVQPWGRRTVRVVYWTGNGYADECSRLHVVTRRTAAGPHDAELRREAKRLRQQHKRSLGRPPRQAANAPTKGLPGRTGNRASFWRGRS